MRAEGIDIENEMGIVGVQEREAYRMIRASTLERTRWNAHATHEQSIRRENMEMKPPTPKQNLCAITREAQEWANETGLTQHVIRHRMKDMGDVYEVMEERDGEDTRPDEKVVATFAPREENKRVIDLDPAVRSEWDDLLDGSKSIDQKTGTVIESRRAAFENGWFVDIDLVSTDTEPFLDVILFDAGGSEVVPAEPIYELELEVVFEVDDTDYRVVAG